jgi:hypothetical protein
LARFPVTAITLPPALTRLQGRACQPPASFGAAAQSRGGLDPWCAMVSIRGRGRPPTVAEVGFSDGALESFRRSVRGRSGPFDSWTARYARRSAPNSSTVMPASQVKARSVPFASSR